MARRKIKVWNAGEGLVRKISNRRAYFYRDGKRVSQKQFENSLSRRKSKPKFVKLVSGKPISAQQIKKLKQGDFFEKPPKKEKVKTISIKVRDVSTSKDKISPKLLRQTKTDVKLKSLCRVSDRRKLYDQIKADRIMLRKFLPEEELDLLRVDIDIGNLSEKPKNKESNRGYRRFKSLKKLNHFLGLSYSYGEKEGESVPDYSKTKGICKYDKTAFLVMPIMRGLRQIGLRVFRKYIYTA